MKVGQQIQFRMDQLGVSVPELAKRIGVSAQAIRFWLAQPPQSTLGSGFGWQDAASLASGMLQRWRRHCRLRLTTPRARRRAQVEKALASS